MQLLSALALAGLASGAVPLRAAERRAHDSLKAIVARQDDVCVPVPEPATCEKSCGPGYVTCISFPTCYNPGNGETCCSDGSYCPAGSYCTDAGCCPDDVPLEQCGATETLSVIPPPGSDEPTGAPEPTDNAPEPTDDAPEPTGKPTESASDCEDEPTPEPTSDCEDEPTPEPTSDCEDKPTSQSGSYPEEPPETASYPEEPSYPSATASSNGTVPSSPSYPSAAPSGNDTAPTSPPVAGSGRSVELCAAAVVGGLGLFLVAM